MTIRHLEIFIAVVDCGKMRLAAEKLFISQPSVSQAIADIESYYGIKVFERLSKKLYITESGERLLKYARHIVDLYKEMEIDVKNSGENICLRIGSTVTVGTCILCPIIEEFEKVNEGVSTKVTINNTTAIEDMLLESTLDLAIIEGETFSPDMIKIPIYQDELVLVCGSSHPFAKLEKINIEEMKGQDVIAREQGSRDRNIFEQLLKEKEISVNIKWSSTNTEAIKNAVIAGQGMAILSSLMIVNELRCGKLNIIPIEGINNSRDICLVYHKNKFISDYIKEFIKVCKNLKL
ncbi:MAG: LysR substrate-binding domain-containing protein [Clostridium sp.]|uniref:LysR family transcriptional regulator n=1 Tax=Clostridium sp. TaxID=1506 RepID=UPI003023F9C0